MSDYGDGPACDMLPPMRVFASAFNLREFGLVSIHSPGSRWHRTVVWYRRGARPASLFAGSFDHVMSRLGAILLMQQAAEDD